MHSSNKKTQEKIKKYSDIAFMIFLGSVIAMIFAPWNEKEVINKTDVLIAFAGGLTLIFISFKSWK